MSQHLGFDFLEEFASPKLIARNLDTRMPKILVILEQDSQSSYFHQVLVSLLGPVLKELEIREYEKKVLCLVLPRIKKVFENSLDEIAKCLNNTEDYDEEVSITVSKLLQVCVDVLHGYIELLINCLRENCYHITNVASLCKTLPCLMLKAFSHCKESNELYGCYFSDSASLLTAFFKKSYEVQTKYYKILEENVIFEVSLEDNVNILHEVLDSICVIGEILCELDIKSSIDTWKPYAKLASMHSSSLRQRLDIAKPLILMSENIKNIILFLSNREDLIDFKTCLRHMKIANFILKIVVKLCGTYKNCLGDCEPQLLNLLIFLFRCTRNNKLNQTIKDELERYIAVGAFPLLSTLIEDELFFNTLTSFTERLSSQTGDTKLGFFFLLMALLKKLIESNEDMKHRWLKFPLVTTILEIYEHCGLELGVDMKLDNQSVYVKLVSSLAAYILFSNTKSSFPLLEKLLFKKLFQPKVISALLVSDLLCLIGRLTNNELCCNWVTYLSGILTKWPSNRKLRPEYIIVKTTASRLFNLTTPKSQKNLLFSNSIKDDISLKYFLSRNNSIAPDEMNDLSIKLTEKFKFPNSIQTPYSFNEFISILEIHSALRNNEAVTNLDFILSQIVNCLLSFQGDYTDYGLKSTWKEQLFVSLLNFTGSALSCVSEDRTINSSHLLEIINILLDILKSGNISMELAVTSFLKQISTINIPVNKKQQQIFNGISCIFIQLLKHKDILVKQTALESYSEFAHTSPHEEIVRAVLNSDNDLQTLLANYLQGQSEGKSESNLDVVSLINSEFTHKCEKKKDSVAIEVLSPPAKKLKIDESIVLKNIHNILQSINAIKESVTKQSLSNEAKVLLSSALRELQSLNITHESKIS